MLRSSESPTLYHSHIASLIYIRTPLIIHERMATYVPPMALIIVRCRIDPRRGIIPQARIVITAIHGMVDRILRRQPCTEAGVEVQHFVVPERAAEMVGLRLVSGVVAVAARDSVPGALAVYLGVGCVC